MSAFPGKVHVVGVSEMAGQKVFALEYLQARDPDAVCFDPLRPATAHDREFFLSENGFPLPALSLSRDGRLAV